jgi:signal transduction histidine kinase
VPSGHRKEARADRSDAPAYRTGAIGRRSKSSLPVRNRLVYDLRPAALDSLGLVGALTEHATSITSRPTGPRYT